MAVPVKITIKGSLADADARYLKLAADNDPLTGDLEIRKSDPALRLSDTAGNNPSLAFFDNVDGGGILFAQNGHLFLARCDASGNWVANRVSIDKTTGGVALSNLAGTGTRTVVADASGALSATWAGVGDLLDVASFSGVNAVIRNPFSATYDDYVVVVHVDSAAAAGTLAARLASGSTPNSSAAYQLWGLSGNSNSATINGTSGALLAQWWLHGLSVDTVDLVMWWFCGNPFRARRTHGFIETQGMPYAGSLLTGAKYSVGHTANTSFDGFQIFNSGGNIAGIVRTYGLRNTA